MEKEFWIAIAENGYEIPEGYTLDELTETLFGYLSSVDPELRDDIAYVVYANWLKRRMYSREQIRRHVDLLLGNLQQGIGETRSDSVFLRTFSALLLAEIVHNDNKEPLLEREQVQGIFTGAVHYLREERDPRGYIPIKGWAHALAHTADLLLELGKNRHIGQSEIEHMLTVVADKLVRSTDWVYIHGEDDRLANAVVAMLERGLISLGDWGNWLASIIKPEHDWKGAYLDEARARAFYNTRNFLRSLSEALRLALAPPVGEQIRARLFEALDRLRPY